MSYVDAISASGEEDVFMKRFKLYKRRKPPPDFSDVIDFETITEDMQTVAGEKVFKVKLSTGSGGSIEGLLDVADWKAYRIERLPGVTFIQNPFLPVYQRYWVCRCLAAYPLRPNVCNLDDDTHSDRGDVGDLWQQAHVHDPDARLSKEDLLYKLRWVTLGYHYDWTKKVYASSRRSLFPTDLANLSQCLASLLGYHDYNAEAAIVNYYHLDSTLSGHVDRSEFDKRAPLLSISFGQAAVFMVGGDTRQIEPAAMLLRSGDIVVLSDESRLAYHAVPRILGSSSEALRCRKLRLADSLGAAGIGDTPIQNNGSYDIALQGVTDDMLEYSDKLECTGRMTKRAKVASDPRLQAECDSQQAAAAGISAAASQAALVCYSKVTHALPESSTDALSATPAHADRRGGAGRPTPVPAAATPERHIDPITYCSSTLTLVKDDNYWRPFEFYMQNKRINMNVRQVLQRGTCIDDYC